MTPLASALALLVRAYQLVLRPLLPPACRFTPSCSAYAIEALRTHGALRGAWLASLRIVRCNPFCAAGYDPVPPCTHTPAPRSAHCIPAPRSAHHTPAPRSAHHTPAPRSAHCIKAR